MIRLTITDLGEPELTIDYKQVGPVININYDWNADTEKEKAKRLSVTYWSAENERAETVVISNGLSSIAGGPVKAKSISLENTAAFKSLAARMDSVADEADKLQKTVAPLAEEFNKDPYETVRNAIEFAKTVREMQGAIND